MRQNERRLACLHTDLLQCIGLCDVGGGLCSLGEMSAGDRQKLKRYVSRRRFHVLSDWSVGMRRRRLPIARVDDCSAQLTIIIVGKMLLT